MGERYNKDAWVTKSTHSSSSQEYPFSECKAESSLTFDKNQAPEAAPGSPNRGGHIQHVPEEHWRAGHVVASEPRGPGSEEVLTAQQLQSKKWKSFLFKDREKVLIKILKKF